VVVATKPVDFRKGAEGLAARIGETMTADPFSGAIYAPGQSVRIKLIFWDGTGLCLFAKRLEDGTFRLPKIEEWMMRLSAAQCLPAHLLRIEIVVDIRRQDLTVLPGQTEPDRRGQERPARHRAGAVPSCSQATGSVMLPGTFGRCMRACWPSLRGGTAISRGLRTLLTLNSSLNAENEIVLETVPDTPEE
jgi:transposase